MMQNLKNTVYLRIEGEGRVMKIKILDFIKFAILSSNSNYTYIN
jgi:hypothetical protein